MFDKVNINHLGLQIHTFLARIQTINSILER